MTYLNRNRKSYAEIEQENKRRLFHETLTDISIIAISACCFLWFYWLVMSY